MTRADAMKLLDAAVEDSSNRIFANVLGDMSGTDETAQSAAARYARGLENVGRLRAAAAAKIAEVFAE